MARMTHVIDENHTAIDVNAGERKEYTCNKDVLAYDKRGKMMSEDRLLEQSKEESR